MSGPVEYVGARGGVGTSTVALLAALTRRDRDGSATVWSHEPDAMCALAGVPHPPEGWAHVDLAPGIRLDCDPRHADILDAGRWHPGRTPMAPTTVGVIRGPDYLGMRSLSGAPLDGVVVVREVGRALTTDDVTAVLGVPILAVIDVDPRIARSTDAGLLLRSPSRRLTVG